MVYNIIYISYSYMYNYWLISLLFHYQSLLLLLFGGLTIYTFTIKGVGLY